MYKYLIIVLFAFGALHPDDYDNQYAQAINLLYEQKQPNEALQIFTKLDQQEPNRSWATTFMCGYTLKVYLKNAGKAIPYFMRAKSLVKGENEDPYKNLIQSHEELRDYLSALKENENSSKEIRNFGKTPSAWFTENRAWLLMQLGRYEEALRIAPPGSWVESQLAPRTIKIEWRLNFALLMSKWGLENEKTIRLSLPLERRYQKVLKRHVDMPRYLKASFPLRNGLRYISLTRPQNQRWPENITLHLQVRQMPAAGTNRMKFSPLTDIRSPLYVYASDNADGIFSLDNPEFVSKVEEITRTGKSTTEKAQLALSYLRANFKYGEKPNLPKWTAHEALKFGSGDCGYYSYISIAMLRALKIPVRGIYGLNSWQNPAPALPHAIIEIYDAGSRQWIPHDPQSEHLFGYINPDYVPLFAPNPEQKNASKAEDGVIEIDTTYFFWSGSGAETLAYNIVREKSGKLSSNTKRNKNAVSINADAVFKPSAHLPQPSAGPLPH